MRVNDFVFAVHGLFLVMVTWSQYAVPRIWGFEGGVEGQRASWPVKALVGGCVVGLVGAAAGVVMVGSERWEWLDVVCFPP